MLALKVAHNVDMRVDTAVIGAGIAGLAAARRLAASGVETVVLEARHRVGGRIHTLHDPLLPAAVELGAEFVHGKAPELWKLLPAACDVEGESLRFENGKLEPAPDPGDDFEQLLEDMTRAPDQPFADYLHSRAVNDPWITAYVEGFNAARKERIGTHALAAMERSIEDESLCRVPGGYDGVIARLAGDLDIRLRTVVETIHWKRGEVRIESRGAVPLVEARRAIVTVPLGVLPGLRFSPRPAVLAEIEKMEMGPAVRLILRFRERFWEEHYPRLSFIHSLEHPVPTWWTLMPLRAPLLVGWAAGPAADRFQDQGEDFLIGEGLRTLQAFFGEAPARHLAGWHVHDWQADPYARGAYSYVKAGGMDAPRRLAEPVEDTLYFAGEHTDIEGRWGTVQGALASGVRAGELARG